MKKFWLIFLLCSGWITGAYTTKAQFDPDKICRIENGQLVFTLNVKWSALEKQQLTDLFDLDSLLLSQVFAGKQLIPHEGETWRVSKISPLIFELSKPVDTSGSVKMEKADLFDQMDLWMNFKGNPIEEKEVFGVNSLRLQNAVVYTGTLAQFYLPGNEKAERVYLAGSFNNWNTTATPMRRAAKGWITDLKLKPGKYAYKYIVDGKWTTDPSNNLTERGDAGALNSVFYCHNHVFRLKGHTGARKVVVTGNFYRWNPRGIPMNRVEEGWELPVWFREGTYVYKFLADDRWMADPGNPHSKKDAAGNLNSFLEIGEPWLFSLNGYADARQVVLTGSFNRWDQRELVMNKTSRGWELPYVVPPGNYEYKFIADGRWIVDPANPFATGSGTTQNSFVALGANHVFELNEYATAGKVVIAGSFNGWNTQGYRLVRKGDSWIFPVYLKPGKYTYKFIVDGIWILDPANTLYEENQYGTGNSVLWIDPGQ